MKVVKAKKQGEVSCVSMVAMVTRNLWCLRRLVLFLNCSLMLCFLLGAKASFYLPNSFSQYQVKQARRKRRELVPPPVSMANEFYTNIALQVKVSPESTDVVILLASNSLGTEFNRIDVSVPVFLSYATFFHYGKRCMQLKHSRFSKFYNIRWYRLRPSKWSLSTACSPKKSLKSFGSEMEFHYK